MFDRGHGEDSETASGSKNDAFLRAKCHVCGKYADGFWQLQRGDPHEATWRDGHAPEINACTITRYHFATPQLVAAPFM